MKTIRDPNGDQGQDPRDLDKGLHASEKIIIALLVIIGVATIVAMFQMMA